MSDHDDPTEEAAGSRPDTGIRRRTYVGMLAGTSMLGVAPTTAGATGRSGSSHGYGEGGYGEGPYRASEGPVDRADGNGDGDIDDGELRTAIVGWSRGDYSDEELRAIVVAWARSG